MIFALNNIRIIINSCDEGCKSCSNNGSCLSCDSVNVALVNGECICDENDNFLPPYYDEYLQI
jgi:hypothetical protein